MCVSLCTCTIFNTHRIQAEQAEGADGAEAQEEAIRSLFVVVIINHDSLKLIQECIKMWENKKKTKTKK